MGGRDVDRVAALVVELDEASSAIAGLTRENEALRRHLGVTSVASGAPSGDVIAEAKAAIDRAAPASAYRSEDRVIALERALVAAQTAVVDLRIENAILLGRAQRGAPSRTKERRRAIEAALVGGGCGAVWLMTENVGMLLAVVLGGGVFWGLTSLIGAIEPASSNGPRPPLYPPGL
jgi:hypothetical protein